MADSEPSRIAHTMLSLVHSLGHSYGITTLARTITGRSSKTSVRKKLHENTYFGALSDYVYEQALDFLEQLIANGYLARDDVGDDKQIIVIRLSEKGMAVLKERKEVSLSVPQRYDTEFTSAHDF